MLYISTHAPLAGSDGLVKAAVEYTKISTHAPLAGSDRFAPFGTVQSSNFNPRSPRGERLMVDPSTVTKALFQPTLPSRGATRVRTYWALIASNFNPRSPRGERPRATYISKLEFQFQPTLPSRGATILAWYDINIAQISTHAPLAGSDERLLESIEFSHISTHAPLAGSDIIRDSP